METSGTVRFWYDEQGWGVIDSDATPGGCWAHFSHISGPGYRSLQPGQDVAFEWEAAAQDGYSYRATRAWPAGDEPSPDPGPAAPVKETHGAYNSGLSICFDNP